MSVFSDFIRRLSGTGIPRSGGVSRLVSSRFFQSPENWNQLQIFCDLDKTYLETEFESLIAMAKIPFEEASDKRTVYGASEVINELQNRNLCLLSGQRAALHFVSSSPPQLRNVLEYKLTFDGIHWTSDTFKNQLRNIRPGRFHLLREHVAYKSAAILSVIKMSPMPPKLLFIGDSAESDAFIYLGIKLLLEGKLTPDGYCQYLKIGGVSASEGKEIKDRLCIGLRGDVSGIFIRELPGKALRQFEPLTDPIVGFGSFFEVVLWMVLHRYADPQRLRKFARYFHNRYEMPLESVLKKLRQVQDWAPDSAIRDELAKLSSEIQAIIERLALRGRVSVQPVNSELRWKMCDLKPFSQLGESEVLELVARWWIRKKG